jgi:succinoglycan biosynthesis transport protein ExoP
MNIVSRLSATSNLPSPSGGPDASFDLSFLIPFLRRQWPIIAGALLAPLLLAALYLYVAAPVFTAKAVLLIDTRNRVQMLSSDAQASPMIDTAAVDSQVEVLRSENIAGNVIAEMRLVDDPEFSAARRGVIGSLLGGLTSLFGGPADALLTENERTQRAIDRFRSATSVRRVGLSYVIEIGFNAREPQKAANIANAIAEAYIVDQLESKYQATKRASVWLQTRLKELSGEAQAADLAVQNFKAENNIVDTGRGRISDQQLTELTTQLLTARAQMAEAKARYEQIQDLIKSGAPEAAVTDSLRSEVINRLRDRYLAAARREADWSGRFGRNHVAAINLRSEMRELQKSMMDELLRIAESYKSDLEVAKTREQSLQAGLDGLVQQNVATNQVQVSLRELESTSQSYRTLYDNLLRRYMEATQQQSFPITEARLITSARGGSRTQPNVYLMLFISLIFGSLLGGVLALLRERLDRVFRNAGQIDDFLKLNLLGMVPDIAMERAAKAPRNSNAEVPRQVVSVGKSLESAKATKAGRIIKFGDDTLNFAAAHPFSRFTEALRNVKVAVDLHKISSNAKVLGMVSAIPNEGKTTVASNFAQLLAGAGYRVLLVDADLRNPALTRRLAGKDKAQRHGLIEVLLERVSLADALLTSPDTDLHFLPVFFEKRLAHTSEILGSSAMKRAIESWSSSYDFVVVDLPPLSPVVDAQSIAPLIDSFIVVIEWGRTNIDVVADALDNARAIYQKALGVVLNKTNMRLLPRYDRYKGSYYYTKYYSRYGYGR